MIAAGQAFIDILPTPGNGFATALDKKVTGAANDAEKKAKSSTGAIQKFGLVATAAVATAAVAVIGYSTKMADSFELAAKRMQNNAGLTTQQTNDLSNALLNTAGTSKASATTWMQAWAPVAGQFTALTGHALSTNDAMKIMAAGGNLAGASGATLADGIQAASNVLITYKLNAQDAAGVTDILYNTSKSLNQPIGTLADGLDKLHAKLGTLSPSLSDTSTLLIELGQQGLTGSRGMLVLSTAMNTLITPSAKVTAEAKALGLELFNSKGQFVGMQSVITQLGPKLATMTDQQKDLAVQTLFGKSASQAMLGILGAGLPAWDKANEAVTKQGTAAAAAKAQTANLSGQIKILVAAGQDLAIRLGLILLPPLTAVVKKMIEGLQWVIANRQEFIAFGDAVADRVAPVLHDMGDIIGQIAQDWTDFKTAFNGQDDVQAYFENGAGWLWDFARAARGVYDAATVAFNFIHDHTIWFEALGLVLAGILAPEILAISTMFGIWALGAAGVGAAIALLMEHFKLFGPAIAAAGAAFDFLDKIGRQAIAGLVGFIQPLVASLVAWWDAHWTEIRTVAMAVFEVLKVEAEIWGAEIYLVVHTLIDVVMAVWKPFWIVFQDVAKVAWDWLKVQVQITVDIVETVIGVFLDLVTGHWSKAWNDLYAGVKAIFGHLLDFLVSVVPLLAQAGLHLANGLWQGMLAILRDLPGQLWTHALAPALDAVGRFAVNMGAAGVKAIAGLLDGLGRGTVDLLAWLAGLPGRILDATADAATWLLDVGSRAIVGLNNGIDKAFPEVVKFLIQLPFRLLALVITADVWLYDTGMKILNGLLHGVEALAPQVWDWFTSLPGVIARFFVSAYNWLTDSGTRLIEGLWSAIKQGWQDEIAFWTDLPGVVVGFFVNAYNWLTDAGSRLLRGLWAAIKQGWANEVSFWTALPGVIAGFFSSAYNWLLDAGGRLIHGLWDAIKSEWSSQVSFFENLAGTIAAYFEDAVTWLADAGSRVAEGFANSLIGGLKSGIVSALNFAIGIINDFIGGIDDVLSALGITAIGKIKPVGAGSSGPVNPTDTGGYVASTGRAPGLFATGGLITNGPAIIGEGRPQFPEFVIPTDPQYRGNAMALIGEVVKAIGMPAMEGGGGIGSLVHTVTSAAGGAIGAVTGAASGAVDSLADSVLGALVKPAEDLALSAASDIPNHLVGQMVAGLIKSIAGSVGTKAKGASGGPPAGTVPGNAIDWITAGMALTGAPSTWLGSLENIARFESGFNPHAINLTDSNAKAGHPSKGLFQTIDSTFAAHAVPGHGDIWNPVDNTAAAIGYIEGRYGTPFNTPGERSLARGGPYMGYDMGGLLPPGITLAYNGTGKPERVISPDGAGGGGDKVEQHFYTTAPVDAYALAQYSAQELAWRARLRRR